MASLSKDGAHGWRILFQHDGKRKTIRTGKCAKKDAETAKNMVERLLQAQSLSAPLDAQVTAWLSKVGDALRDRLARAGLIEQRERAALGPFIDRFIEQGKAGGASESTVSTWKLCRAALVKFFGADKPMHEITPADADRWAAWLRTKRGLAENSARFRARQAKQFFSKGVEYGIIDRNPLKALCATGRPNKDRQRFIDREIIARVLPECPGDEHRLLVVMARYMGLRVPSEIRAMRWVDVNWSTMTLTIHSPKKARHSGGGVRVCPIFPEVQPALQAAWEAAPEGAEFIFPTQRREWVPSSAWFPKAIERAGLVPWPKLWNNLRSTRATELCDVYPSHICAAWLGHTAEIADAHYRQVTPEHLARATSQPTGPVPTSTETGTNSGTPTARNASNSAQAEEPDSAFTREKMGLDNIGQAGVSLVG